MKKSLILKFAIVCIILLTSSFFAACIESSSSEENIILQAKYISSKGGYIEGETTQNVIFGEYTNEVTAVPCEGYKFIKWSDGKNLSNRQDKVTDDFTVTAEFEFLFEAGDGSKYNPFLINCYEQLLNMAYYPSANYILVKDLCLENIEHTPIFDEDNSFSGCFDGNGNTICCLNVVSRKNFSSVFGFVGQTGIIKNLNLANVSIEIPDAYNSNKPLCIGTVAGVSLGLLSNINVEGEIKCDNLQYGGIAVGGLVGQSQNVIDNCCTNVRIILSNIDNLSEVLYIGGLVGITEGNLSNCESNGQIKLLSGYNSTAEGNTYLTIGGLIGVLFVSGTDVSNVTIDGCVSAVDINSECRCSVGGLLGASVIKNNPDFYAIITDCSVTGDILSASGNVAGFVCNFGNIYNALFYNCHSAVNVTCYQGIASGFIGRGRGLISYCSATGNVNASSHASGFCDYFTGKIFRSFAKGNVYSQYISTGFGLICAGIIEECFCTGTVNSTSIKDPYEKASGFFFIVTDKIINCYSTSDVIVQNHRSDVSITAVGITTGGTMYNCYYAGKITINNTTSTNSMLGTLTGGQGRSDIINCHWLYHDDSLINFPFIFDRNPNLVTEVYRYDNKQDMCTQTIVDALNNGENDTWVLIEDDFPNLRFFVETYVQ